MRSGQVTTPQEWPVSFPDSWRALGTRLQCCSTNPLNSVHFRFWSSSRANHVDHGLWSIYTAGSTFEQAMVGKTGVRVKGGKGKRWRWGSSSPETKKHGAAGTGRFASHRSQTHELSLDWLLRHWRRTIPFRSGECDGCGFILLTN